MTRTNILPVIALRGKVAFPHASISFEVGREMTLKAVERASADGEKLVQIDLTVTNTSDRQLTMFAEDFQLQWGDGDEDYGTCLTAVDTDMVPYSYTLEPGNSHSGIMLVEVPEDSMTLTVAYQEMLASGKKGDAYFVEAEL